MQTKLTKKLTVKGKLSTLLKLDRFLSLMHGGMTPQQSFNNSYNIPSTIGVDELRYESIATMDTDYDLDNAPLELARFQEETPKLDPVNSDSDLLAVLKEITDYRKNKQETTIDTATDT